MNRKREEVINKLTLWISEPSKVPGGRLPSERELALEMGVSRSLLREALITLEVMGILEVRERSGIFVKVPAGEDFTVSLKTLNLWPEDLLIHLMEMRLLVEVPAAGLAAGRRNENELDQMRECVKRLNNIRDSADEMAASGAFWDSLLHTLVVDAAHNPILTRLYEGLATTMEKHIVRSRNLLLSLPDMSDRILQEHGNLVKSIADKDPDGAMNSLRNHLEKALKQLSRLKGKGISQ